LIHRADESREQRVTGRQKDSAGGVLWHRITAAAAAAGAAGAQRSFFFVLDVVESSHVCLRPLHASLFAVFFFSLRHSLAGV